MLYANNTIPLYRQLYRHFRKAIATGELRVGEKLPSERQLAADYGISRITARKAMDILKQEGYICAFQGRGAFVAHTVHSDERS
jgi:DNA-binding GntR family transcriptional regulator